jgi:MFS family permease
LNVRGAEQTPGSNITLTDRLGLIRNLTLSGWLLLGGSLGLIAFQLDRARSVNGARFAGAWDQRIEVLSFLMLPPNLVVLTPAAAVAATTTWLAGTWFSDHDRDPWLQTLLRLVIGVACAMFLIGIAAIVSIGLRDSGGPSEIDAVLLRLGGMSLAAGIAVACRAADRFAQLRHGDSSQGPAQ